MTEYIHTVHTHYNHVLKTQKCHFLTVKHHLNHNLLFSCLVNSVTCIAWRSARWALLYCQDKAWLLLICWQLCPQPPGLRRHGAKIADDSQRDHTCRHSLVHFLLVSPSKTPNFTRAYTAKIELIFKLGKANAEFSETYIVRAHNVFNVNTLID